MAVVTRDIEDTLAHVLPATNHAGQQTAHSTFFFDLLKSSDNCQVGATGTRDVFLLFTHLRQQHQQKQNRNLFGAAGPHWEDRKILERRLYINWKTSRKRGRWFLNSQKGSLISQLSREYTIIAFKVLSLWRPKIKHPFLAPLKLSMSNKILPRN